VDGDGARVKVSFLAATGVVVVVDKQIEYKWCASRFSLQERIKSHRFRFFLGFATTFHERLKVWKNEVTWPRTAWSGPFTTTAIITSSHNCKEDQNFGTNQDSCSFGDGE
jgi:hypothetical protein